MLGVPLDENMEVFMYILSYYDEQLKSKLMNEIEKLFQVPTSIHLYNGYGDVFKKGNRSISIQ